MDAETQLARMEERLTLLRLQLRAARVDAERSSIEKQLQALASILESRRRAPADGDAGAVETLVGHLVPDEAPSL